MAGKSTGSCLAILLIGLMGEGLGPRLLPIGELGVLDVAVLGTCRFFGAALVLDTSDLGLEVDGLLSPETDK